MTKDNTSRKWKCYLWGFMTSSLLFVVIFVISSGIFAALEDSEYVLQNIIILAIEQHVNSTGEVPKYADICHVSKDINDTTYYPDSWGKSGKILLKSKRLISGSFVVTFGDGAKATLSNYREPG